MVLDDHLVDVTSQTFPLHSALNVGVPHSDGEFHGAGDVFHAGDRASLRVHLSVKECCCADICRHVPGVAVDAYIVAGGEFISGGFLNEEVGFLHLCEGHCRVVGQTTDVISGVVVVVAVAPEGRVVAKVLTVLLACNRLVHRVHCLQDLAAHLLVETELARGLDTVDLHVVDAIRGSEAGSSGHALTVHRGQPALPRCPAVLSRPVEESVRLPSLTLMLVGILIRS